MRILLLGEYSRLHNSLKEGLQLLGHEVILVGGGDGFKAFPVDYYVGIRWAEKNFLLKKLRILIFKISGNDPGKWENWFRFLRIKKHLKGFDVVQFINSDALQLPLPVQKRFFRFIQKNNSHLHLLICGSDTPVIEKNLQGVPAFSILTPYIKGSVSKEQLSYHFDYLKPGYVKYFRFFEKQVGKMLVSDIDYLLPMQDHPKFAGLIPNPINTDKIKYKPLKINGPVVIFHGVNRSGAIKKGNFYFERALREIKLKYQEAIRIISTESLPYEAYMKAYEEAHIVLDQVYAHDQGYNALEAMARGKVVFTGADVEFMNFYKLKDRVAINARPDVEGLVKELSYLIEHPAEIEAIGRRARTFIENNHHYLRVAERYLRVWTGK